MFLLRKFAYILAASVTVLVLSACTDGPDSEAATVQPPAALAVPVVSLTHEQAYDQRRDFTGRVEASRQSNVGFELGGQLVEVLVDEGTAVAAGDVIARLDTARLLARQAEARAALNQGRAQADLARATRARIAEALEFRAVTRQDFDEADSALTAAMAAVNAARSRLDRVAVDVGKATLTAPYDAVVIRRFVDEGQILAAGQPLVTLQEIAPPAIRVGVAGDAVDTVQVGGSYDLNVRGQDVQAIARAVLPVRDGAARTVDVLFDVIPGQASRVRPGDLARLQLYQRVEEPGYWVPLESLAEGSRGLWSNYVLVPRAEPSVGATHAVQTRAVDVLFQNAHYAYVRGALEPDDLIVSGGLHRIVPGQSVRVNDVRVSIPGRTP